MIKRILLGMIVLCTVIHGAQPDEQYINEKKNTKALALDRIFIKTSLDTQKSNLKAFLTNPATKKVIGYTSLLASSYCGFRFLKGINAQLNTTAN